jgi:anti-sigma factor RsiW
MVNRPPRECERVRAAISAALDDELSEFESVVLRVHLDRCAACREFEASTKLSTTALRLAPLEPLSRPIALPNKHRRAVPLGVPAAAAAAVLMVAFGGIFESIHSGAAIRGSQASQAQSDNLVDIRAMAKRQQQANFRQQLIRRAQFESNQIPRHPGFQP